MKLRKLELPDDLIPKDYIGEKFGVLLVFIKGDSDKEIQEKREKISKFCEAMRQDKEFEIVLGHRSETEYRGAEEV